MDNFLSDVNISLFKEWILNQNSKDYNLHIDEKHNNKVIIETSYCIGEVVFQPQNIIELSIINSTTKEILFYLHFQMTTLKHAIDLFNEMIETLLSFKNQNHKKILICCSSGLTSSFFASKVSEALQVLSYDYTIQACSYTKLLEFAPLFDIILLAPQISYLYKETKEKIKDKLILNIPSSTFAKYNVGELLSFVHDEYIKFNEQNAIKNKEYLKNHIFLYQRKPLLCISVYESKNNICILKTLIKHEDKLMNDLDVRSNFTLSDLKNIIDTCLLTFHIEKIHISIPGYIKNDIIHLCSLEDFNNFNLTQYLKHQYPSISIYIENNNHCKAIGYNHMNSYKSLVFLTHSKDNLYCSIILNNKLITGDRFIAGYLNNLPIKDDEFHYKNSFKFNDTKLIKTIVSIICIISPEIIVFNEDMNYVLLTIQEELAHYLPQDYIPILDKSKQDLDYLLLGQMLISNDTNK